jgi:hypothetical protein
LKFLIFRIVRGEVEVEVDWDWEGERVRVEVFDFLSCQRSGEGVDTSRETAGTTTFL